MEQLMEFINIPFMLLLVIITEALMNIELVKKNVDARIINKIVAGLLVGGFYVFNIEMENFTSILISFAFSLWTYDDIVEPFKMLLGIKKKEPKV